MPSEDRLNENRPIGERLRVVMPSEDRLNGIRLRENIVVLSKATTDHMRLSLKGRVGNPERHSDNE